MPLQTFFNLPKEKQAKIINAAKNEFTENSFYDASINKIIKEAGISRGSFYMYFENKEDLFLYLMEDYREKMIPEVISNLKEDTDIFNIALSVFDYIINLSVDKESCCFLSKTLNKMDVGLLNKFIKIKESKKEIQMIKKYSNVNKFKLLDDEEYIYIGELLLSTMVMEMMFVFNGKYTAFEARKRIERKFEMIKYGILK